MRARDREDAGFRGLQVEGALPVGLGDLVNRNSAFYAIYVATLDVGPVAASAADGVAYLDSSKLIVLYGNGVSAKNGAVRPFDEPIASGGGQDEAAVSEFYDTVHFRFS